MMVTIEATNSSGSVVSVATEDAREALQSLFAFQAANFKFVAAYDDQGALLLPSDLETMMQDGEGDIAK